MKFLDADVKRPLASVNRTVFGLKESCVEHAATGLGVSDASETIGRATGHEAAEVLDVWRRSGRE